MLANLNEVDNMLQEVLENYKVALIFVSTEIMLPSRSSLEGIWTSVQIVFKTWLLFRENAVACSLTYIF